MRIENQKPFTNNQSCKRKRNKIANEIVSGSVVKRITHLNLATLSGHLSVVIKVVLFRIISLGNALMLAIFLYRDESWQKGEKSYTI